jgi:arabinofuranan 3-O-arabinosyltransferase
VDAEDASILVVHENANAGWRATVDGHRLHAVMVDGWQQGWLVPAGTHGVVTLDFTPQRSYVAGLIVGAVAVVLLLVLAFARRRLRSPAARLHDGQWPNWLAIGVSVLGSFLLLSWPGLVIVALLWSLRRVTARWTRSIPPWLGGVLVIIAGCADAIGWRLRHHLVANSAVIQVVVAIAILSVVCTDGGLTGAPATGRDSLRSKGRSK